MLMRFFLPNTDERFFSQLRLLACFLSFYLFIFSADNDQEELFDKILDGKFEFLSPFWDDVSSSAKVIIISLFYFYFFLSLWVFQTSINY